MRYSPDLSLRIIPRIGCPHLTPRRPPLPQTGIQPKEGILPSEESSVADQKKCAHASCSCMTDKKYCSTYCEEHKNTSEIACDCGHPGCKGKL